MNTHDAIWVTLQENNFSVTTDTRKEMTGSVYFAIKGENFDGNSFSKEALAKGAIASVTEDPAHTGDNIYVVENVLKTLQDIATQYRKTFSIPIIVIGGSNGKTTSKDLLRDALSTKYITHSTVGSLNNHLGVPLSILSMKKETEIGIFEIGANHPGEHTQLLNIIGPTHVVVTNNGMDHLEGFGTPDGSRKANKEIYDWAQTHKAMVFVHKKHPDLLEDSTGTERILYPEKTIVIHGNTPLVLEIENKTYTTQLVGEYNIENIELAVAVSSSFGVDTDVALEAICEYTPLSKRSQYLTQNNIHYVIDCYNANPSSMISALESFEKSVLAPRGVIIGDMLELGTYSKDEHKKIVDWVKTKNFDCVVYVGERFKKALGDNSDTYHTFSDSTQAQEWFETQNFETYTFLLKGSRGMKIEKILE